MHHSRIDKPTPCLINHVQATMQQRLEHRQHAQQGWCLEDVLDLALQGPGAVHQALGTLMHQLHQRSSLLHASSIRCCGGSGVRRDQGRRLWVLVLIPGRGRGQHELGGCMLLCVCSMSSAENVPTGHSGETGRLDCQGAGCTQGCRAGER